MGTVVTAEQRANKSPVMVEWVKAKDAENARTSQADPNLVSQLTEAANQYKAQNWGPNGTANGMTENQNLAAVANQPGNTSGAKATPYITPQGTTDYHITGGSMAAPNGNTGVAGGITPVTDTSEIVKAASDNASPPVPVQNNPGPQQAVSTDNNALIQSIYDAQYAAQAQKLKALRDQQLAGLAGQDDQARQSATSQLNANDVTSTRNSNAIKEQLASLGLLKGGDYITRQTAENTSNEQNAFGINQNLGNQLKGLTAQKDAINNNASADDLALLKEIQAAMGGAQLNDAYKQQDYGLNLAQLSGQLPGGGQTLAALNADRGYGLDLAGLTGNIGSQKTLAAQSLGLQAQNQGFNQNLQTNQFNQGVKNDTFNQGMANKQFDYQKVQDDIKNKQWSTTTENSMKQWAEGNKLDWAQFNQQTKQALAQLAISQQNANTNATQAYNSNLNQQADNKLQQDKFAYDTDKNNIDNLYKQSQIDKNTADAQKQGLDDAYYKAVTLAQKDPLFASYDATKQAQVINTHYENLKPKDSVTDNDISSFLKK